MGLGIGMHMGVPRFEKPGGEIVKDGLVLYDRFTSSEQTYPSQGSAEFDGASDYILIKEDGKGSAFDTQEFTIGAWMYIDTMQNNVIWSYDLASHVSPYYAQQFRTLTNGTLYFATNQNGSSLRETSSLSGAISAGNWYYVSITREDGAQNLYIDGSIHTSTAHTGTISYYNQEVWIGKANFGGEFNGNLSNVAFWNRALSSDEINSVMWKSYATLDAGEKDGLQAWYALDDINGTNVPDSSGNGHDGTAN